MRRRQLTENMLSYVGPHIGNPNLNFTKRLRFAIKIEQIIDSELDASKNCRNYPTEEYSSFSECDEKFVQLQFRKHFDNITPFWVTDNLTEVTSFRKWRGGVGEKTGLMEELIDGSKPSSCKRPCLRTKVCLFE